MATRVNRDPAFPDCHSLVRLSKRSGQHACLHPCVHSADQLVHPEICKICKYRLLPAPEVFRPKPSLKRRYWRPKTVAVIIPCHNYGQFLTEAVDSVLTQTRWVDEILIVDDSSTDDTPSIARSFRDARVRYLRTEHRHSQRARRAGFEATGSDVVCFLDADDLLARDYLELGMKEFSRNSVGLVYSDVEHFGAETGRSRYPVRYDRDQLARMNYMHTGCLVLREALEVSRGLQVETDDALALQDWLLWRRVLDQGWLARKQKGLYLYRKHGSSMTADWRPWGDNCFDYFHRAALASETITLFIPLSGRSQLWPETATFLERQTWPHDQVKLILFDTSQNAEFSRTVRRWIAGCDYFDVRHLREAVGEAGLADRPRREVAHSVSSAMARIYNRLARESVTDYVWIVEDDVLPPPDACSRLLYGFDRQTASVSAAYWSRFANAFVAWGPDQQMIATKGDGLEMIGGNGFGCVLLRGEALRKSVFTATLDFPAFDNAFYFRLPETGLKAKIDWSVECQHFSRERKS